MSLFRRLLEKVRVDRHPYQPALTDFPAIDLPKLRREMKLEERGRDNGKANLPPADRQSHDDVELEVVTRFEQFRDQAHDSLAGNLQAYSVRLARLDNAGLADDVERQFDVAMSDFKTGVINDKNRLYVQKRNVLEVEHEYVEFRRSRKLNRVARYPDHWFKNVSVVLLVALIDTVANAFFFSTTHPGGWAGAIFESMFIAIINTVVGFGAGVALVRGLNRPSAAARALCFLLLVATLAALLAFNTFAAHYRDAFAVLKPEDIGRARDVASADALRRLVDGQYRLAGFQSYLMVAVGMLVACIAMFEGYRLDDPLPGFGALARHRQRLLGDYAAEKEMLSAGLTERRDEALADIDAVVEEIRRREEEFAGAVEARRKLIQRYNGVLTELESAANQLIETYRTHNAQNRSAPAPPYFAKPWAPNWAREPVPEDGGARERGESSRRVIDQLKTARRAFLSAYDDAVREYDRIDHIVTREALDHARAQGQ
jgi:hypothetical protein